ncbi:MAG: MFS transporter, partial [Pseudomonadales bacterium]|nr:MFS transporter [Pseudomonadales bacterium]
QHLNRNIAAQLAHGMLGQTGFRLFSAPTFLPVYLYALSGSEFIVGLSRSLESLGQTLTPMLGASLIGHRKKMLGITLFISVLMRLQILFIALTGLFLGASGNAIWLIIFFMVLMGIFQGVSVVMMNSLRARVIPVRRRGMVAGWRNFLSSGTTAILAYFAGGYFIDHNVLGDGYAALFLLAFVIASLGIGTLAFTKEPPGIALRKRENVIQSFKAVPGLLRGNPAFARFFVVGTLGSIGRMAMPFYILYASTQMEISGAMLGVLTTIWMLAGTATNIVWGSIADRSGYRLVLIVTLSLWTFSHFQLLFVDGILGVMLFFALFGTSSSGFMQARQNMVLELGLEEDIPLRIAVSNMANNMVAGVGPMLGGLIALTLGYEIIFIVCIFVQLVALYILVEYIPEPRRASVVLTTDED